jgi:hypothetical protein
MLASGGAIVTKLEYCMLPFGSSLVNNYDFHLNAVINNTDFHLFATATIWSCYRNYEE